MEAPFDRLLYYSYFLVLVLRCFAVFVLPYILLLFLYVLQDSQSKLFTPAIPRPSPDGGRENEDTDPGGNGKDTVRYFV